MYNDTTFTMLQHLSAHGLSVMKGGQAPYSIGNIMATLDGLSVRLEETRRDVLAWGAELWFGGAPPDGLADSLLWLDELAFFGASLNHPLWQTADLAPVAARIRSLYEDEYDFYSSGSWRLIPLNEVRKKRLAEFNKSYRRFFPWYLEWCDAPINTLERLVEWRAGKIRNTTLGESWMVDILFSEVVDDPEDEARLELAVSRLCELSGVDERLKIDKDLVLN